MDDGQYYEVDMLEALRQCAPARLRSEVHLILACRRLALELCDKAIGAAVARLYRVRIVAGEMKITPPTLKGEK